MITKEIVPIKVVKEESKQESPIFNEQYIETPKKTQRG
jgi:hypothetical protein